MILGISGRVRTGSTSLAGMLSEHLGQAFRLPVSGVILSHSFKELLSVSKDLAAIKQRRLEGVHLAEDWYILQNFRQDNANLVAKWLRERLSQVDGFVIVDGVRFPGEATSIHAMGGKLVRLYPHMGWAPGERGTHPTEDALDDWEQWDFKYWPRIGRLDLTAADLVARLCG